MIEHCDIMLFNFTELGLGYPHIGALWECGLGDCLNKSMIAFGDKRWKEHAFMKVKMMWVSTFEDAIDYLYIAHAKLTGDRIHGN
jgi:hypothetical protein